MTHIDRLIPVSQALPHCGWVNSWANKRISEGYLTKSDSISHMGDSMSVFLNSAPMLHEDMEISSTGVQMT